LLRILDRLDPSILPLLDRHDRPCENQVSRRGFPADLIFAQVSGDIV
jgi:hypothetical protein